MSNGTPILLGSSLGVFLRAPWGESTPARGDAIVETGESLRAFLSTSSMVTRF